MAFGVFALMTTLVYAEVVPPGTDDEIRERLQPFGSLCRTGDDCGGATRMAGSGDGSGSMTGEQVYKTFCFACHATGVSESPLLGDTDAWAPRIAKGIDALWESTANGLGLMPVRGTCMNCSDDELRAAMDYVTGQAQ
ncbi:MAG: c-type cytochrome [Gammaproteobacteria bacterium]|nr:c-type cytochrome [Gammaproteobacteria bacterium]